MKTILFTTLMCLIVGCQRAPTATADSPVVVTKAGVSEISPAEARPAVEAAYSQFIDVRTADEYTAGHAYRARNIPLDTLLTNLDKLEKNEPVYLICATDNRSRQAAQILVDAGFPQAIVVKGGTAAWKALGLPMANGAAVNYENGIDDRTRAALTRSSFLGETYDG